MKQYAGILIGMFVLLCQGHSATAGNAKADVDEITQPMAEEVISDETLTEEEIEAWFNDDSEDRALAVNEGKLEFLEKYPEKPVHHSHNTFTIGNQSLITGWIDLLQCHTNLDAVFAAQIVYRYQEMKNLHIESSSGIAKAWVEGKSVQLEDIGQDARLCIGAEVRLLHSISDHNYVLRNGPFHRKFLDGYYPMQVTLDIRYPSDVIEPDSIKPVVQTGFSLNKTHNKLTINALFVGELMTEIRFTRSTKRDH